jgi:hypothetical protein
MSGDPASRKKQNWIAQSSWAMTKMFVIATQQTFIRVTTSDIQVI